MCHYAVKAKCKANNIRNSKFQQLYYIILSKKYKNFMCDSHEATGC